MIGGLVRRLDGSQEPNNYGAVFSVRGGFTSTFPWIIHDPLHGEVCLLEQFQDAPARKEAPGMSGQRRQSPLAGSPLGKAPGSAQARSGCLGLRQQRHSGLSLPRSCGSVASGSMRRSSMSSQMMTKVGVR